MLRDPMGHINFEGLISREGSHEPSSWKQDSVLDASLPIMAVIVVLVMIAVSKEEAAGRSLYACKMCAAVHAKYLLKTGLHSRRDVEDCSTMAPGNRPSHILWQKMGQRRCAEYPFTPSTSCTQYTKPSAGL